MSKRTSWIEKIGTCLSLLIKAEETHQNEECLAGNVIEHACLPNFFRIENRAFTSSPAAPWGTSSSSSGYIPPKSPATSGLYRRRKEERREGKLARQMKDRRKYYDTWMEGDEACAQLSLWEELLSPPGFSFTNGTVSEKTNIDILWDVMGEMFKKRRLL